MVKELVKNALDAGARRITVETKSRRKGIGLRTGRNPWNQIDKQEHQAGQAAPPVGIMLEKEMLQAMRKHEVLTGLTRTVVVQVTLV